MLRCNYHMPLPEVCEQCCQARVTEEFELRLTYSAATIYVRKVTNHLQKLHDQTTTSNPIELLDSDEDCVMESGSGTHTQVQ